MKFIAVIPARYAASRFPGKLLQALGDKSVLAHTYLAVKNAAVFDEVIIATDHQIIVDAMRDYNAQVVLTSPDHTSGSDRIAEAVSHLNIDVVVNVQGDEPFIHHETLHLLKNAFENDVNEMIDVVTLKEKISHTAEIQNPNLVKVITDKDDFAIYFSRATIPYQRDTGFVAPYFKHIGVYAFRKNALMKFSQLPPGILEQSEKLEQLRYLENGFKIKVIETDKKTIGIDTPEDLEAAIRFLREMEQ
ncbi:MAG: 3-deoxy-manno-octulosonate cytidylyltransferase [Flavobacteriaceae bacterium]|nr:3-deoxy-manno-octulosonate cytidylyltransferase [Flavobacteriaceae bacterium]